MSSVVLDAGAFIAFERGDAVVRAHLEAARRLGLSLITTSPIVAQVWRDGTRQVLLARLVNSTDVVSPSLPDAKRAGELCRETRTADVVDALLVVAAPDNSTVLTSDPDDIRLLKDAAKRLLSIVAV